MKIEYTLVSCFFIMLNLYSVLHNHTLFGMGFGVTAAIFGVKALRSK